MTNTIEMMIIKQIMEEFSNDSERLNSRNVFTSVNLEIPISK